MARLIGRLPGGCRHHLECAAALLVNIEQALSMPLDERRALHDALFQVLMANDGKSWGERSLVDPDGRSNYRTGLGGLIRTDLIGTLIFQLSEIRLARCMQTSVTIPGQRQCRLWVKGK